MAPKGKLIMPSLGGGLTSKAKSGGGGTATHTDKIPLNTYTTTQKVTVYGTPDEPPAVALPTSQTGILVPYIIGRQRVSSPNVIWYGNLQPRWKERKETFTESITEYVNPGFGEIGYNQTTITETTVITKYIDGYNLDMQMGICLGPDVHLREIFLENVSIWSGNAGPAKTQINFSGNNFLRKDLFFYGGSFTQEPDDHLESVIDTGVPGYVGLAYVVVRDIDATGSFPTLAFEVERFPNPLGLTDDQNRMGDDINLATAVYDVINNAWGAGGVSSLKIDLDSFTEAALTLRSEGNACSIYTQNPGQTLGTLRVLEEQADGTIFSDPSTDTIKFRLFRKNFYVVEDLPLFDESNVISVREFSKPAWESVVTKMQATYTSRKGNYSQASITALNPVANSGDLVENVASGSYPCSMTSDNTSKLVSRDLSYVGQPLPSMSIVANRKASELLPGDAIRFSWNEWGIENYMFGVTSRRVTEDKDNQVILSLKPLVDSISTVVFAPDEDSLFDSPNPQPNTPDQAEVFSAPYWISARSGYGPAFNAEITRAKPMFFVDRFNSYQTVYDVYVDNFPDQGQVLLEENKNYCTWGLLANPITLAEGFSTGIIPTVDIASVTDDRGMVDVGNSGVRQGRIFVFIDDEIMSFEASDFLGSNTWRLTNVHRGLLDTAPQVHAAGARVLILNGDWTQVSTYLFQQPSGYTPTFRFVPKSLKGTGDVSTGLTYNDWEPDDRLDRPLRPHDTKINGSRSTSATNLTRGATANITWKARSRSRLQTVALQLDAADTVESDQVHRVFIRDSADVVWDCGVTSGGSDDNAKTITVPAGAAAGAGELWVQTETALNVSLFHEELLVNLI